MMQENNNFNTIISTWRRMSEEQAESVTVSMSGDSHDYQLHKKREDESTLLVPEKISNPIVTTAGVGAVATIAEIPSDRALLDSGEEKLLNSHNEEGKEAAGDSLNKSDNKEELENNDYLENNDLVKKLPENKLDNKSSDKVDSVFINPSSVIKPPPTQSSTSSPDEDDCIVKCLYYTLQCCDCVLM